MLLIAATGKAQEDQAEIGQREVEDVDHSGRFGALPKWANLAWGLLSSKRQTGVLKANDMKLPRPFYQPLAIGAPQPLRDLPVSSSA